MKYGLLFQPAKINNCALKNRFVMAPMGTLGLADSEGGWTLRGIDYFVARARGGAGLLITGVSVVEKTVETHTLPSFPCPTHNPVHFIRTSRELVERVHAYGTKIFIQLTGGFGRVAVATALGEFPPVAPSPIPHRWEDKLCRELSKKEIRLIVKAMGEGAYISKRAGFDGVQIHAVHEGYLIDQFSIAATNQRTDEYGGSLENRLRFAREVVEEIKVRCGADFPVTLRYSPKSFMKGWREGGLPGEVFEEMGRDMPEGLEAAKLLVQYGYDALDVDVGCYDGWWWSHPPMYFEKGMYMPYVKPVKEVVDVPVICAGRMDDPEMATRALEDGTCDLISLGRPLLADPDYVNKLARGRIAEIRPCLSCHEGCMGRIQEYSLLGCAVNPACCREKDMELTPACQPKRVMVIGGGVAGCEAARVLALRGHCPVVYERTGKLGGNLIPAGTPDFKEDDRALASWYAHMLELLKVPVYFNTEATAKDALDGDYDAVIIATGSNPITFSLGHDSNVHTANDALCGNVEIGDRVVIVGGGLVGSETALWLAKEGKKVTLVEMQEKILQVNGPTCFANKEMLEALLPFHGVTIRTSAKVVGNDGKQVTIEVDGKEETIPADTVILAVGFREEDTLYRQLLGQIYELYLVGDAKEVENIMYAIWNAYEIARNL